MITVIGNSPVDLIADVSDEFLHAHALDKGCCTTISLEKQSELLNAASYRQVPGGSGANLAAALALLGAAVHYIGPFGNDELGRFAVDSLAQMGVECAPYKQDIPNQIVFTYLTPDGDRSFAAAYDNRTQVPVQSLTIPAATDLLVIDGYTILYPEYRRALEAVLPHYTGKLCFCPNDTSVVVEAGEMAQWLYQRADIIVLNRDEAKTLLHPHKTETVLHRLQIDGKSGALTAGAEGAMLFTPDQAVDVPSVLNPSDFVDSNGAGDAFSAGYLYGMAKGWDLTQTGLLASRCAAVVLATHGARAPADLCGRALEERL